MSDDKTQSAGEVAGKAVGAAVDVVAGAVTGSVDLAKGAIKDPVGTARGILGKAGRFLSGLAEKPKSE
jgi:hypothetical protein